MTLNPYTEMDDDMFGGTEDIGAVFDQIAAKRIEVKKMAKALGHVQFELEELEQSVDDWRYEQVKSRVRALTPQPVPE